MSARTPTDSAEAPLGAKQKRELSRRQAAELFRLFPSSIALSYVGAVASFAMLLTTGDAARGVAWFALATAVMLFRSLIWWQYTNDKDENNATWWARFVIFGNIIAGIQWALLGTWLYVPDPTYRSMFTAIIIVGYVAGAVITLAPVRFAHAALAVPATLPVMVYIFVLRPDGNLLAGVLSLFMLASVIYLAEIQHQAVRRRLLLEMDGDERLRQASEENNTLGQSFRKLEHRAEVVKRAQIEARRRAEALETHVKQTLLPVIECDHLGRIIEWNDAATDAFGYLPTELSDQNLSTFVAATDAQQDWQSFLNATLNQNKASVIDAIVTRRDGTRVPTRLFVTPIGIDGKAMRAAIIATDPHGELASRRLGKRNGSTG